jgi:hypothetical protein
MGLSDLWSGISFLQVSDAGDALYAFPSDFVSIIKNRSLWLELAPLIAKFNQTAGWLARVSFGAALVASVALVWITIVALLTASSQDNNRDNRWHLSPPPFFSIRNGQGAYF